jgi:hypothetical protein
VSRYFYPISSMLRGGLVRMTGLVELVDGDRIVLPEQTSARIAPSTRSVRRSIKHQARGGICSPGSARNKLKRSSYVQFPVS